MAGFSGSAHWRDSSRAARFFLIDARAAFPFLLFLLHIRMWTFIVAVVTVIFFGALERYGFSVTVFLRALRTFFAGSKKTAQPWWKL